MATTITSVTSQGRHIRLDLAALLSAELREASRIEANAWIKRFRLAGYGSQTMRERFTYRGDSLWWFTELYLHKMRRLDTAVATVFALEEARDRYGPTRLVINTSETVVRQTARAFGHANAIAVDVEGPVARGRPHAWPSYLVGLTTKLSRLRRTPAPAVRKGISVAAFVHTAFWRGASGGADGPHQEGYIGPVLDEIARRLPADDLVCVGVGPRRNFRARRWWDPVTPPAHGRPSITPIEQLAPRRAVKCALEFWERRHDLAREIVSGFDVRACAVFRGLDLWAVVEPELQAVALLQWPWSARAMDEAAAAIDALEPAVVVTYAEAGGWGRALVLEARRRGVRSVGVQHGFIYRHWLNYLHEPDEMEPCTRTPGFPAPDSTLVFDRFAANHLTRGGAFRPSRLTVTGNARLDDLAARVATIGAAEREDVRRSFGTAPDGRLVILAAKFSELGERLGAIVAGVSALPTVRLVIKTHPAETPESYRPATEGVGNIAIAPAQTDLARLIAAADGLITMNSTVAVDAMVLGVPALVVGLPNNLSPFVDAGVMLGTGETGDVRQPLERLLYDRETRARLESVAQRFMHEHGIGADGHAAERAADAILGLANE